MIKELPNIPYLENTQIDFSTYFDDIIGVTKMGYRLQTIKLFEEKKHVPYVITKPMHASQTILEEREDGTVFSIHVIPNFELEKEILGYGEMMRVLAPESLIRKIKDRITNSVRNYEDESINSL